MSCATTTSPTSSTCSRRAGSSGSRRWRGSWRPPCPRPTARSRPRRPPRARQRRCNDAGRLRSAAAAPRSCRPEAGGRRAASAGRSAAARPPACAAAGVVGWRSWTRARLLVPRSPAPTASRGRRRPPTTVTYEKGTLPSKHLAEPAAYGCIAYPAGRRRRSDGGRLATRRRSSACPAAAARRRGRCEGGLRFGDFVADGIEKRGVTPFAVAAVQAGDTYWHARAAGDDAMAMLFDEFIPFLRDGSASTGRWRSWAGRWAGATGRCGRRSCTRRTSAAVCGVSAALWRSYEDGVGDAFDSAADYARNDVYADAGNAARLCRCGWTAAGRTRSTTPTWPSREALPEPPAGGFEPGGHNDGLLEPRRAGRDRLDRRAVRRDPRPASPGVSTARG